VSCVPQCSISIVAGGQTQVAGGLVRRIIVTNTVCWVPMFATPSKTKFIAKELVHNILYDINRSIWKCFLIPFSLLYKHLVNLFGGTPVYLDTYETGFGIDPQRLEKLITPRTKLLLLNSRGNPTGRIFPKAKLQGIAKVCGTHGITVISDEIYWLFSYAPMTSMAEVYDNTLVLVGHSKTFCMTGWRLG